MEHIYVEDKKNSDSYKDLMIEFYFVNGKRQESVWRRDIIKTFAILIEPYLFKDVIHNFQVSLTRGR